MRRFLAVLFGAWSALGGIVLAITVGSLAVLPFIVLPRGRRERYAMRGAAIWSDALTRGVLLVRPEVTGRDRVPDGQGALYMCNHRSWLDPLLMITYTRSIGLSKSEIFWLPFVGIYAWVAGAVYVNRRSPESRHQSRREVMWLIERGHRITLFPEGTRSRDGKLREEVYLTLPKDCFEANLPVVPCAVHGTERTLPPGEFRAWPLQRCRLEIGEPMWPSDHPDAEAFAEACWDAVKACYAALEAEEHA